jgi:cytochrome c peroxidase
MTNVFAASVARLRRGKNIGKRLWIVLIILVTAPVLGFRALAQNPSSLPNHFPFVDPSGIVETHSSDSKGKIDLTGPFFQELGTNGRSCGTCHQPSDAWTVSAAHIKARFDATGGTDPIFRTVDGSNCDQYIDVSTVAGRARAYSLLTSRGLIRIALSVPAGAEFEVVSVNNPYGCNDTSTLSMYRRPLPAANLRFLSTVMFDGRESSPQTGTKKITYATNADDLLFDLAHQAVDATLGHAQGASAPTAAQQQAIVNFEMGLSVAQAVDFGAGNLDADGANGGPLVLSKEEFFIGYNDSFPASFGFNPTGAAFTPAIFNLFDRWLTNHSHDDSRKASIARGQALFNSKPISISGVAGVNDALGLTVVPGTCGTCHDSPNVGNHSFPAPLNIGTGDLTSPLDVSYLPVITLKNKTTGAVVQTTDPGRAMVTGSWGDIGKVKGPVLRGIAARAPYFHNGSGQTLLDVINFYDRRFGVGFTDQEKADLVAFLSAL